MLTRASDALGFFVLLEERPVASHICHQILVLGVIVEFSLGVLGVHEMVLIKSPQHILDFDELAFVFTATEQVLMHGQEQELVLELDELLLLLMEVDEVVRLGLTDHHLAITMHDETSVA